MKRSSHHIIIPILAIVLLAVSSCFKNDTGIPSIRDFEELIRRVPVSGVRLNVTARTLTVGDTYTLTPTVTPSNATEKGVSWTSSNIGVATVDQGGKVTALKEGSATITAKTTDGGYTATCNVTVKQPELVPPEAVDLGLSVQWASCNLGASRPEEYGGYYQWAGTQDVTSTSIYLDWYNCPYHTGSSYLTGWTKYIPSDRSSYWSGVGSPDNKTLLDLDDDVAHVTLRNKWRMPTDEEWSELTDNCTWTWTTQNGVIGYKVTSNKSGYTGKSIFLPAAGNRNTEVLDDVGSAGYYWCSVLYIDNPYRAHCAHINSSSARKAYCLRNFGLSVRPVYGEWGNVPVSGVKLDVTNINLIVGDTYTLKATISPSYAVNQNVTWSSDNTGVATVDQNGKVTALKEGSVIITVSTTDGGYTATCSVTVKSEDVVFEAVDLGLSVKWASWNLGAYKPEEYGGYYQWAGRQDVTSTSIYLDWNICPYHSGTNSSTGWTKYIPYDKVSYWSGSGSPDGKTVLDPDDDVAHVKLGGLWRMPTDAEWKELTDNCSKEWITLKGVEGEKFTSNKNGNSIFLPAGDCRLGCYIGSIGYAGRYWSSSLYPGDPQSACNFTVESNFVHAGGYHRCYGLSVRPVYGDRKIVPVSGVTLNKTNLTLTVGDTYALTPTVTPSDATENGVSWSSNNTGVATVDQRGKVTAWKDGSATITVQTTEGGHTASCIVTVKSSSPTDADYLALLGTYTFTAYDYFTSEDVTGTLVVEKGTVNATYKISIPGINFCPEDGPHIDYFECPWDKVGKKSFSLISGTLGSEGMIWNFAMEFGDGGIKLDIFYFNNPDADIDAIVLTADQDGNLSVTSPVVPEEDSIYLQSTFYNADGDTKYVGGVLVFDKGMKFIKKDASAMKNTVRGEFQPWRARAR